MGKVGSSLCTSPLRNNNNARCATVDFCTTGEIDASREGICRTSNHPYTSQLLKRKGHRCSDASAQYSVPNSTTGRRFIISYKEDNRPDPGIPDDGLRRLRQDIIEGTDGELKSNITGFYDFYSLQECRDMLVHVQEHTYTLPQIADMLARAGLRFIAFGFVDSKTRQLYRKACPNDPAMTNLDNWNQLEQENRDIFASMYVFWAQKI